MFSSLFGGEKKRNAELFEAAARGNVEGVQQALEKGADINAVDMEIGLGAFGYALDNHHIQLAKHLLDKGAVPNYGLSDTLPLVVAEYGDMELILAIEARGGLIVTPELKGRIGFVAARNKDGEVFDYILNHGADLNYGNDFGYTPLILAALNNRPILIRRYLGRGDDASIRDVDGETALSLALEKKHDEAIEVLREFHVEEKDYSVLEPDAAMLKAAKEGVLGTILNLRDQGVSINSEDEEGNSPMMLAVKSGYLGAVRSLYHIGANINHHNRRGETALGLAKASEASDIVNSLQEFGALDAVDGDLGKAFSLFGGVHVYNAVDVMFGRMSHPYKEQPPYEEADADDDANEDQSGDHDDGLSEGLDDNSSVEAKLDMFGQLLESDQVKGQLPEAVLEQLVQKLDHWRSLYEESQLDDDELTELNRILGMFGIGDDESEDVVRTPLFEAVYAQDISVVKKIIKGGGDVNEVDGEGNTALLIAVLTRKSKLVEELLKLGADANQARPDGKGPLFGSVRVGEEKIAQLLLKGGAKVDANFSVEHNGIPVGGCTALYAASLLGQLPFCRLLLINGAQIDSANDLGYTPLMAAIEGRHDDVIDFFLKSGANVNPEVTSRVQIEGLGGASPLITATRNEHVVLIKKLLKRGVDVNRPAQNGWTPLKSAAQQGNLDIVKVLLDAGADPNIADNTNYTPLMNAVSGEHEDIVKLLLKFSADPNVQSGENPEDGDWEPGRTALMDAAVSGNVLIARELLKQGANPNLLNSKGRTALHSAVISANADMVSLLLKSGADPDIYGNDDGILSALDLALHRWASEDEDDREGGVSDVLELMLKNGFPQDCSSLTDTTLSLLTSGHEEVMEFLQKHGITIDVDEQSQGATRLFMHASLGDHGLDAANALLKFGANPNFRSKAGLPVLSMAVRQGGDQLVESLLKAGADVMARNGHGVLPYDLAAIYGRHELALRLIDAMNLKALEIDMQDADGNSALMRAVKLADLMTVKQLLSAGAVADRRDFQGDTPLSYAVTHDLDEIADALRSTRSEMGFFPAGSPSLVIAAELGALGTVLDLLDAGAVIDEIDDAGETALTAAIVHPGVLKVLARRGADLAHKNQSGNTAYMIASASDRGLIMSILAGLGSPVEEPAETDGSTMKNMLRQTVVKQIDQLEERLSEQGEFLGVANKEALELALKDTKQAIVTGYVSNNDSDESDTESYLEDESNPKELLMASLMGDAVAVSNQIAIGVDVNCVNDEGLTALAMAIQGSMQEDVSRKRERDFEQILDLLLVSGADPTVGQFPYLVFAAMGKRLHLVNALIRSGVSVDRTIGEGETALFMSLLAPDAGKPVDDRCAVALLKAGANASLRHESGAMPIHLAAASNYLVALKEILERRPQDVDAKTNIGITPLMMASTEGHAEMVALLLKFGADRTLKDDDGLTAKDVARKNGNEALIPLL